MVNKFKLNLFKILDETTIALKEKFPEAQTYLLELSKDDLQTRLTSGQALKIAEDILKKMGFKAESQ